ncbi:MAG: DUF1365 family protein [Acidimicrobiales bacterium]
MTSGQGPGRGAGQRGQPSGPISGPGPAAVCPGTVLHHRHAPADHRFTYPVTYVWFDPHDPDDLCRHHRLWSVRRPAPVRYRRADYLDGGTDPLGAAVRRRVADALGVAPDGPIRTLTQLRTWGWLFNPITVHLLWPADDPTPPTTDDNPTQPTTGPDATRPTGGDGSPHPGPAAGGAAPTAALIEVTNTPWKERHFYPVALTATTTTGDSATGDTTTEGTTTGDSATGDGWAVEARFAKVLHVSPFLDEDHHYRLRVVDTAAPGGAAGVRRLRVALDVFPAAPPGPTRPPTTAGEGFDRIHRGTTIGIPCRGSPTDDLRASDGPIGRKDGDDGDRHRSDPAMTTTTTTTAATTTAATATAAPYVTTAGPDADVGTPVLSTALVVDRHPASRRQLGRALRSIPFPTHRVSAGIHRQALALWRRGVPFVPHPRHRQR